MTHPSGASGDVELQANIVTGVGGGARFQLELGGAPIQNYTLAESVLLRGNWLQGRGGWGNATDDPDNGRHAVLTPWSTATLQIRVALRDAELFSLSVGCTQQPHYTQCHRGPNCSAAWGRHYNTIPCKADGHCEALGTCAGVVARCVDVPSTGADTERVCAVINGTEQGPVCGWF